MTRYKFMAAAAGLALTASIVSAGSASANTGPTEVRNADGLFCLDATNDATHSAANNGDPVQVWECQGTSNQQWTFNENVGSYGTITNGTRGLCLDAVNDATHSAANNGDPVQLWSCNGGAQQQWKATYWSNAFGYNFYELTNLYSGLVLDARNDATWNPEKDGDPVQLWSWQNYGNQGWSL